MEWKYYFFDHYDPSYNEYAMWIGETVVDGNVVTTANDGGVVVSIAPIERRMEFSWWRFGIITRMESHIRVG